MHFRLLAFFDDLCSIATHRRSTRKGKEGNQAKKDTTPDGEGFLLRFPPSSLPSYRTAPMGPGCDVGRLKLLPTHPWRRAWHKSNTGPLGCRMPQKQTQRREKEERASTCSQTGKDGKDGGPQCPPPCWASAGCRISGERGLRAAFQPMQAPASGAAIRDSSGQER